MREDNLDLSLAFALTFFSMSVFRGVTALRARTFCVGSHADFGRVVKQALPVGDRIKAHLSSSAAVLYMKGEPNAPSCGFSWKTVQILETLGAKYDAYNVLLDEDLRQGIKTHSAWPTIPQLYINGEFVGGCDIVEDLARSGELKGMLKEAGALKGAAEQES